MNSKRKNVDFDEEVLEQQHFQRVIDAFLFYRTSSQRQVERKQKSLHELSPKHQEILSTVNERLEQMMIAVDRNYEFIKRIIQCTGGMFVNSDMTGDVSRGNVRPISGDDLDRVRTTLKQFVRDWSTEGKCERDQSYKPILSELDKLFPSDLFERSSVSVLVPGAGLGRLMFEIALQGFECQGNEFSMYMLFASNYILNICDKAESVSIHPWVHQTCNILANNDQLREIKIPDINPRMMNSNCTFSMAAGDFLEVYSEENSWDCVAMCFFLDTAHNVLTYIEKVYHILKPGGYWINFGPLLYHFADIAVEPSVELTYEEVRNVILNKFKFTLIKERTGMKANYVQNSKSMLKMEYECAFFIVQKPFIEE